MMLCNFLSNVLAISMVEEFYIYAVVHFFFAKRKSVTYECNTKVAGERDAAEQRPPHRAVGRPVPVRVLRVRVEHHNTIYSCHFI